MKIPWPTIAGWYHAVLLGALPWCAWWDPRWAPVLVAGVALVHLDVRRSRAAEPWSSAFVPAAVVFYLAFVGGWKIAAVWLALGAVVAAAVRFLPREDGGRPDAADLTAVVGWAAAFAAKPELLTVDGGGWLAPAVLLLAARQLGSVVSMRGGAPRTQIGPPTREVRGTLSLRGVVAARGHLPATVPIDLDLRAGESLAVLCADPAAAQIFADVLAGRIRPFDGEILVDGAPMAPDDRLAAVVAPGELFVVGSVDDNLGALRDDAPDRATRGAARDACGLVEVVKALDGRPLDTHGGPLETYHRLLVLSARALVSHYRMLVVVDPGPWVDFRQSDLWRAALVRASVGRTAIWITGDQELADRADYVFHFQNGALGQA